LGEAERRRREPSRGAAGADECGVWGGEETGEEAVPPPHKFFSIFGLQIATLVHCGGYFYGSVDCFGRCMAV